MKRKLIILFVLVCAILNTETYAQVDITIGTGTVGNTTTSYPCPLQDFYEGSRMQYLYLASELTAAGMSPGTISAIRYNVVSIGTAGLIEQYTIKMGGTTATTLSPTSWENVNQVYGPVDYQPIVGINSFTLTTPFFWNGSDNIVVEVCNGALTGTATGTFFTQNPVVTWTTGLPFNGSHNYRDDNLDNLCGTAAVTENGTPTTRPNIVFAWTSSVVCSGAPVGGTAVSSSPNICAFTPFTLSVTGSTLASGLTYQWQSSTNGVNWSPIAGATSASFTTTQSASLYYRRIVTCTGSGASATSTAVQVLSPLLVSGTFTINSAITTGGTNFQSFNDAYNYIKCGINAPVVFNVATGSGPYNEQLIMQSVPGSSATNTVTINGNGRTIKFSSANTNERAVIKLNGASHIRIDSLVVDATPVGSGTTYGYGVQFINNADSNVVRRCTISTMLNTTSTNYSGIVMSASATSPTTTGATLCDSNYIAQNTISGGYYSVTLVGSTVAADVIQRNVLLNNAIKDFYFYGVYTSGVSNLLVEGNDISRPAATTVSTFYGIYLTGLGTGVSISKNRIHNPFAGTPTTTNTFNGIYITGTDAVSGSENRVTNNLIYDVNGQGIIYALYNSSSDYALYYHNTISLDNTASTSASAVYGFYQITLATGIQFFNNIVSISRGGTGAKYGIYMNTTTTTYTANRNDYYLNATGGTNYVGYNGSNQATLAAWQTATGKDANSLSTDPMYVTPATGNFTPSSAVLNDQGTFVGITTDIINAPRSATVPDIGAYEFTVSGCFGTPAGGTAVSTLTNITCYGSPFTLSLNGSTLASGLTYQWQTSTNNTTWTSISGATISYLTTTQTDPSRYYRAIVTCTASGASSSSASVQITSVGTPPYATLPIQEQFENPWVSVCSTRDVPSTNWLNTPSTGNSSWRRDDDGVGAAWTSPTLGAYTPAGSNNTPHSARFHSYSAGTVTPGTLDIYINANTAVADKRLVFDYINNSGTDSLDILVSTNGGTNFTLYQTLKIAAAWTNQTVDFTTTSATTIIRFRASGGGTTDMGVDEVNVFNLTNCTGVPLPGTVTSSISTVCVGNAVSLAVTGQTYGQAGITYQWQSSTNNTTWTDIAGANGIIYNFTVPSGYITTYYRFVVKCSLSNQTANSNTVQVIIPAATYAALPFTETFETNWINFCDTKDIPNNSWRNTPATGNNSWRRDDDGATASWGSTAGAYTPTGSNGSAHSARFHSFNATSGLQGNLDLFVNCSTGGSTKRLKFDYINTTGNDSLVVLLSTNNGQSFTRLDSVRLSTIWKTKTIIFNASSATTVLRFQATSDFGGSDIGLDSIVLISFPNCSGTPATGTAIASQTTACIGSVITLSLTGHTVDQGGLSYKWQSSTDNTTWTDLPGANTEVYSYTVPSGFVNTYFRAVTNCSFSAASANSAPVLVTVPAATYATLPVAQSFDSIWVTSCATRDIPNATGWKNVPFTGNNSWRREDDTTGGGWTNMLGTPASLGANNSAHYARIHTYATAANGNLDLYINGNSGTSTKEVSFSYINPSGTDSLRVFLSTNGGVTFTPVGFRYTVNTDWDQKVIAFTSTSATTVIRFAAYGTNDASTDIGIDQVTVKSVECAQPPNVTSTVTSPSPAQSTAVLKWAPIFNALAYEYVVSTSPTVPNYGDITGDTTVTINTLTPLTQYYVFVRSLCFSGNISSWYTFSFTTPCPSQPLPYIESFESITTANTLPSCMVATGLGTNVQTYLVAQTTFNRTPHTGTKFAAFRNTTPAGGAWIFTQPFNLNAGVNYAGSFWYRTGGLAGMQIMGLYYGTSQDPASMIKIDTLINLTNTDYLQMVRAFQVPSNGIYYLGIRVVANTTTNFLSVDDIELRNTGTFPVTLLRFRGEARGDYNQLDWETATEINSKGFMLERSKDGINFSSIGSINSKAINGSSNSLLAYSFTDAAPLQGINYYRLKQIDKDNKFAYSNIVTIKGRQIYELHFSAIYPNPATSELNVTVASPRKDKVQIIVTDMVGKQVQQVTQVVQQGETKIKLNVAGLTAGSYVVKLVCEDGCNAGISKFIKQ